MGNKKRQPVLIVLLMEKKDIDNYRSLETLYSQLEELIQKKIMQLQEKFFH